MQKKDITRRDFIKNSALAAVPSVILSSKHYSLLHNNAGLMFSSNRNDSQNKSYDDWFKKCYRKLFFDFHTKGSAVDVVQGFDAERWAEQLQNTLVQAVIVTANCQYGYRYYQNGKYGYIHPKLPADMDMAGEIIKACHKRDINVIAYFNVSRSESILKNHKDWIQRNNDGEMRIEEHSGWICLLSPYFEDVLLPQLEEFHKAYEVNGVFFDYLRPTGICFCHHCREKFRNFSGKEIPLSPDHPDWKIYIKWVLDSFKKIREETYNAVHRGRESTLTCANVTYTTNRAEIPPDNAGFLSMDIEPNDQVFEGSFRAKYWATLEKPFDIMSSAFDGWWGDWGMKPSTSLKQECATIIANGGRTWIGYQATARYTVEKAVMNEFKKTFQFVKEREEYCNEAVPVPYIAVLHSTNLYFTDKPTFYINDVYLQAAHKMLIENGFHYNIVNEKTLLEKIDNYKLIILSDQRYVSEPLADALRKFVEKGGSIISTLLTATQDPSFNTTEKFAIEDIIGVKLEKMYPHTHAYYVINDERLKKDVLDMPHQAFGEFVYVKPTTAKVSAQLWDIYLTEDGEYLLSSSPPGKDTGYPGITINNYGKGKAAYICGDIFRSYVKRNQWNLKNVMNNLINILLPEKLIEIDAPNVVEVVLTKKGNNILVHLINHYGSKPLNSNILVNVENNVTITEDIMPIHDIGLRVKVDNSPESVKLMPENIDLSWEMKNGIVSVDVPKLDIYSIVILKM